MKNNFVATLLYQVIFLFLLWKIISVIENYLLLLSRYFPQYTILYLIPLLKIERFKKNSLLNYNRFIDNHEKRVLIFSSASGVGVKEKFDFLFLFKIVGFSWRFPIEPEKSFLLMNP
jgi:hypothetical protein